MEDYKLLTPKGPECWWERNPENMPGFGKSMKCMYPFLIPRQWNHQKVGFVDENVFQVVLTGYGMAFERTSPLEADMPESEHGCAFSLYPSRKQEDGISLARSKVCENNVC
jgi:hypothetical protein